MTDRLKMLRTALLAWIVAATGCEEPSRPPAWSDCRLASCWDGPGGSRRMMNILSPHIADEEFRARLDWQRARGCDHVHVLLCNGGDGEGAGYDALLDPGHRAVALRRVRAVRDRGLGVVAWVVSDDSDALRRRIFADPSAYARALRDYFPHVSYIVLGLEMDEGAGSLSDWTALRDAVLAAGWSGPVATHHRAGRHGYAGLGQIVMDQLPEGCAPAQVAASVAALRRRGYAVCGFEYARGPARGLARAALEAGAFGVGNW